MKEIIYVQAGSLANYTGTHFWNTQESYLAEESADSVHNFDVSFREGLTSTGKPSFCPRLLVFDRKTNFGTLAKNNALLGTNEDELPDEDFPAIWGGDVMEYRQDLIPKSTYHVSLDESDDEGLVGVDDDTEESHEDVRYWSDFNRVYYIPRSVQKIPDPADWESPEGDWRMGQALFSRYDEDHALMDGSLRLFFEECDSPQGLQVMNDTATFGGFINSFLTSVHDEHAKLPCLVFPLLSDAVSRHIDVDDYQGTKKAVNDALYLRSLNDFASMTVPIQFPETWPSEARSQLLKSERGNVYRDSAILSAHIETATLPLRLKGYQSDLSTMSSHLNWRGTTPYSELSGVFPVEPGVDLEKNLANFSSCSFDKTRTQSSPFTRIDVTRGFTSSSISAYDRWSSAQSLQDTFISRVHAPPYPIPTSYPSFFKAADGKNSRRPGILTRPVEISMFSSLSAGSGSAHLFSAYATAMETCLQRKFAAENIGIDSDDLKELATDLWTLHDNFGDGDGRNAAIERASPLGTDEE
ncbi:Protein dml-1 [Hypsizygus marmoreus]|uniref:Protein dml-1 n=1 Tax=Hypsizygus marmoreus TaxID=39966 RepID=A0A369JAA7_HYPMA|nr:Protein dml-1 [Hypsizygus marmoreus]